MLNLLLEKIRSVRERFQKEKRERFIESLKNKGLKLGNNVQFAGSIFLDPSHCLLISIGNNVTFAPNVRIIAHDASSKQFLNFTLIGKVNIHDDCFIGDSVFIMPGVTIGPRAIIGAGAIVTRDIPENSVAVGNPARVICSLDDFLAKRKKAADEAGVFGREFMMHNLSAENRDKLVRQLDAGPGFIV